MALGLGVGTGIGNQGYSGVVTSFDILTNGIASFTVRNAIAVTALSITSILDLDTISAAGAGTNCFFATGVWLGELAVLVPGETYRYLADPVRTVTISYRS